MYLLGKSADICIDAFFREEWGSVYAMPRSSNPGITVILLEG